MTQLLRPVAALFLCLTTACDTAGRTPDASAPIEYTASHALGVCYPEANEDGSSNFSVALADVALMGDAETPSASGKGRIVVFDLCAIPSAEGILPGNTYSFAEDASASRPGSLDYGFYQTTDGLGTVVEEREFVEATATVWRTFEGYKIELSARLDDGRWLHCVYVGPLEFTSSGGNPFFPGLTADVKTTFVEAESVYYGPIAPAKTALYVIDLYGDSTTERNTLSLLLYSDPMREGRPAPPPGTYRVGTTMAAGTLLCGTITPDGHDIVGSYCEHWLLGSSYVDDRDFYGLVSSGTVEIQCRGAEYTITAWLRDADGFAIEGSYTGPLECWNESYYSILETGLEVDLAGMPCTLEYHGDYRGASDKWSLFIGTEADGSEAFRLELLASEAGYADGLRIGTYRVKSAAAYVAGEYACVSSIAVPDRLYASWYLADYQDGMARTGAPLTAGRVCVARSDDDYTIVIDAYDDAPALHRITATWTGKPLLIDKSGQGHAPARPLRAAAGKRIGVPCGGDNACPRADAPAF